MRKLLKVLGMCFLLLCVMTGISTTVEAGELSTTYTLPSEALYEGQTYWIKVNVYGLNSGEKVESYQWKAIYDGFGGTQRLTLKDNDWYAGTQTETFGFITADDTGEISQSTWDDSYGGFIGFYCEIKTTDGRKVSSARVHIPHPLERTPVSLFLFTGVDAPMDGQAFDTTAESLADTVYTFNRLEWYNTDNDIAENKLSSDAVAVGGEQYCCRLYFDMLPAYEIDSGDVNCGFHDGDDKFLYDSENECYYIKAFYTALKPVCITQQPQNKSIAVNGIEEKTLSFSFSAQNITSYSWQIMEVIAGKNGHGRKVYTDLTTEKIEKLKNRGINISIDSRRFLYVTSSEVDTYYFRCVVYGANDTMEISSVVKASFYIMDGWYADGDACYYYEGGSKITGWKSFSIGWFYFDETGVMQTDWIKLGDNWYYFYENGIMAEGWLYKDGHWFYLDPTYGYMVRGWKQIDGKWYYFTSFGYMETGWVQVNEKWYYFNPSGYMVTGWKQISSKWYYFSESGSMYTGWLSYNSKWYYLNPDGDMKTGWLYYNGSYYYLNAGGDMRTGWLQEGSTWYYLKSDGRMACNETLKIGNVYYKFNSSGAWVK